MSADRSPDAPEVRPADGRGDARAGDDDMVGLLEEARRLVGTDTASLLLLNEAGTVLEPIASVGLEHTVRAATRVPIGHGFAGQVALSRQPMAIDEVNGRTVLNPVLRTRGIQALLGAPVMADGRLLGVVHVGSVEHRTFNDTDVTHLLEVAGRVAESVETIGTARAHAAALILQRSLLPSAPREIEGLEVAARYVPAEGDLGGDWYDVFELPDGAVGLVMGDVVGHGLNAAVIMGRLRSALRSYALDHPNPAVVLERLDRKIRHFEDDALATVVYGVTRPPFDRVVLSCAGHWAPLVAGPEGRGRQVDLVHDPMLGIDAFTRHTTSVPLGPGAAMCFFTDGLVERPDPDGDALKDSTEVQLELVLDNFDASDDPETACSRLITSTIGDDFTDDDIALLVVRRDAAAD